MGDLLTPYNYALAIYESGAEVGQIELIKQMIGAKISGVVFPDG